MSSPDRTEEFVSLQMRHQQRILSFILTLVPEWADAEDILQETGLVLWQKFADFETGSDFVRWANQVAYFEVLKFRKRRAADRLEFSEQTLDKVRATAVAMSGPLQDERDALQTCLGKLSPVDRDLVDRCYGDRGTVKSVALEVDRPVGAVYKSLQRIRGKLLNCVRRVLSAEERK